MSYIKNVIYFDIGLIKSGMTKTGEKTGNVG